jgi:hypothetical protein
MITKGEYCYYDSLEDKTPDVPFENLLKLHSPFTSFGTPIESQKNAFDVGKLMASFVLSGESYLSMYLKYSELINTMSKMDFRVR